MSLTLMGLWFFDLIFSFFAIKLIIWKIENNGFGGFPSFFLANALYEIFKNGHVLILLLKEKCQITTSIFYLPYIYSVSNKLFLN